MSRTVLFSDVHLKVGDAARPARGEFIRFLRDAGTEGCDRLICLGDLFDFWFEYRHVCFSGYHDVLRAFSDLHDAGVELHLFCGNHDFWAGRFLRDEIGFVIHPDEARLPFGERRVLMFHGDGVNPEDRAYRAYKKVARNPWVVGAFRLLHPDWAMTLAQGVSHGSRSLTRVENPSEGPEAAALRAHARALIEAGLADTVVCGHAHAPALEWMNTQSGLGLYINTGDWMRHRTYVTWDGTDFEMGEYGQSQ
ncbi:MAG: UDP-2,3-diacylglucosamine diphosphatase [Candidatus Hydrogenedentes bacterium]|nr:UDP-2,3-diacylglucosamine diphosphatase [Candidatus Hydrogenedentota bacterium]